MRWLREIGLLLGVVGIITTPLADAYALEGLQLVKAGFTITSGKEDFQKKEIPNVDEIQLAALQNGTVFFWTEIQCTQECQHLNPEKIIVVHRWVRDYGVNVVTTQTREFSLKELLEKENLLQSEQEIKSPGAWFVEVRIETVDGQKLCISTAKKDKADICKFLLRVK